MARKHRMMPYNTSLELFRVKPLSACIKMAIAGGVFFGYMTPSYAGSPLPVPAEIWNTFGKAQINPNTASNVLQIVQTTDRAILNWKEFDVAKGYRVDFNFKNPGASSIALNRIFDNDASVIRGSITANGQVYLVNQNGFVFDKTSSIDVNTLVASALNITDKTFIDQGGIVKAFDQNQLPALGDGNNPGKDAKIDIQNGAKIHVAENGRLIMAAPTVTNSGNLSADKYGQIILVASKDKVYLQPIGDNSCSGSKCRTSGLLVEVGSGGKVTNTSLGNILARQGNITLAGFAVNQQGRVSATTATNVNGSIRLLARELGSENTPAGSSLNDAAFKTVRDAILDDGIDTTKATVSFGHGSITKVVADTPDDPKRPDIAIDAQFQPKSYLETYAHTVHLQSGAAIGVPGGLVDITALGNVGGTTSSGRIILEKGSSIDVSGAKNITASVTRNIVDVPVQSFELRDSPLQKGGVLQGQTIRVDIREKNPIVDFTGALARIERGIDERLGNGGIIKLTSGGDVIVNPHASFNISGGTVNYTAGYTNTTKLLTDYGAIIDIADADPNQHYQAVYGSYTEVHEKWGITKTWQNDVITGLGRYEQAYQQGLNAGNIDIKTPALSWNGDLVAGAASGLYQRTADTRAYGGRLAIANTGDGPLAQISQDVLFETEGNGLKIGLKQKFPKEGGVNAALVISTKMLNKSGLQDFSVNTQRNATIAEAAKIVMAQGKVGNIITADATPNSLTGIVDSKAVNGSNFNVTAYGDINFAGSFYAPNGAITLKSGEGSDTHATPGQLTLASTAKINVSGRWVNDFALGLDATPTEQLAYDAGTVTLTATGDLDIQSGADIKADGGAWLAQSGQLTAGKAGTINLKAVGYDGIIIPDDNTPSLLHLNGSLSAYGIANGGTLSLTSGSIVVGAADSLDPNATDLPLVLGVKDQNLDISGIKGFGAIELTTKVGDLVVKEGTTLKLSQQNRILNETFRDQASSQTIAHFSHLETLLDPLRHSVDLTLTAHKNVILETDSKILGDKQATISLTSEGISSSGIYVDGLISAPAGEINLNIDAQSNNDEGQSKQAVWLGKHAQLLAAGASMLNPVDALGRRTGEVLDGGEISLTGNRGYLVLEQGSKIDVSGTKTVLDLPAGDNIHDSPTEVGSNAGKITLTTAQGAILDGELRGKAGNNTTNGGRLDLSLNAIHQNLLNPINQKPLALNVRQDQFRLLDDNAVFGETLQGLVLADGKVLDGNLTVSSNQIMRGGFDDVRLAAINTQPSVGQVENTNLNFLGDVSLSARTRIDLEAPIITWQGLDDATTGLVKLNTAYLRAGTQFHSENNIRETTQTPELGGGSLTANTQWTEFTGASLWDRFSTININSAHDIRAVGLTSRGNQSEPKDYLGEFMTAANLNLTASQIYPSTLTKFSFSIENNPDGKITVSRSGNTDASPLSAGGALSFIAPIINQNGVVKAPFGNLNLTATKALTLGAGSVTSVSGAGQLIPFGNTFAGLDWLFPYLNNSNIVLNAPPEKKLVLAAPKVTLSKGSTVDLSGGGDLLAYEFQSGIGGSTDYLARTNEDGSPTSFAIVPGLGSTIAPVDPIQSVGFDQTVGSQVYLSGTDSLKAGFYTLLPAHYALLPGAFLVTPQANSQDQRVTTLDSAGLSTVAGYRAVAGTGIRDARWSGFLIENGTDIRKHSKFEELKANTFFAQHAVRTDTATPLLPIDSGQLVIKNAETKLTLQGDLKQASAGGRGARVDIAAKNLKIVNTLSTTPSADFLEVLASDLTGLHADSVLLGGERSNNANTGATNVNVSSDQVVFDNNAHIEVTDLIAAAKQQVTVKSGASLTAQGTAKLGDNALDIIGDGALLRVSADQQVTLNRTEAPGTHGILAIEAGATLSAPKSMLLDASQSTSLAGDLKMQGGSLNLSANGINIGELSGQSLDGSLNLSNQKFLSLDVDELILTSRDTINFFGNVGQQDKTGKFNPLTFNNLVLNAAGLAGFGNANQVVSLQANNLTLENKAGKDAHTVGTGQSELNITAQNYNQGNGVFTLKGFNAANINVEKAVTATGNGTLKADTNLHLTSGYIASEAGATLNIDATGHQAVFDTNAMTVLPENTDLAGTVSVKANAINFDARALLPSGKLSLNSLTGDVLLGSHALVDVAGRKIRFADVYAYTPGGIFSATADDGKVVLADQSVVDVTSGGGTAASGKIDLHAVNQHVELLGQIKAKGGSALLDVADFSANASFNSLTDALMTSGISNSLYVRAHQSDIVQDSGHTISVDKITLVSDSGNVRISGALNADKADVGGVIKLLAGDKVTLEKGANLSAKGTGSGAKGGEVLLASTDADNDPISGIDVKSGSLIDVSGGVAGTGGEVVLRALRTNPDANGVDHGINISPIAGTVRGFSGFYADGVKKYDKTAIDSLSLVDGTIDAAAIAQLKKDTEDYMSADNIRNINAALSKGIQLRPGLEINYDSDLKLTEAWNFLSWGNVNKGSVFFPIIDGERAYLPGILNVNVSGQFKFERALSDGFIFGGFGSNVADNLISNDSWSYQLAAGADLSSADKSAVVNNGHDLAKDLIVAENINPSNFDFFNSLNIHNTVIRTGTGNIEINASGNVVFEDNAELTFHSHPGESIYTAGKTDKNNPYGTISSAMANSSSALGFFPYQGGDLTINAGHDIKGSLSQNAGLSWLIKQGGLQDQDGDGTFTSDPTSWGIAFNQLNLGIPKSFNQNVGAFGGGNVDINAGGNINDLIVSLPTTGKQFGELNIPGDITSGVKANKLQIDGGGQLNINASGDITGGEFYLGQGKGVITAGGAIRGSHAPLSPDSPYDIANLIDGPQLLLGDADLSVSANKGIAIGAVTDPMIVIADETKPTLFFSYGKNSALHLSALVNDVQLASNTDVLNQLTDNNRDFQLNKISPPSLDTTAFTGNVLFAADSTIVLFPSAQGNLSILAKGKVSLADDVNIKGAITLSDVDPQLLPSAFNPQFGRGEMDSKFPGLAGLNNPFNPTATHAKNPIHSNDNSFVRIVTQQGNIENLNINLSKKAIIQSGHDLVNNNIYIQHANKKGDASIISAARDVVYPIPRSDKDGSLLTQQIGITVAGSGNVLVKAGRNIDFGLSDGLTTLGNQATDANRPGNPVLGKTGASVTVQAGLNGREPNYLGLTQLDPIVLKYAENFNAVQVLIRDFMRQQTGNISLSTQKALDAFKLLDPAQYASIQPKLDALVSTSYTDVNTKIINEIVRFVQNREQNTQLTQAQALKIFADYNNDPKHSPDEYITLQPTLAKLVTPVLFDELNLTGAAFNVDNSVGNGRGFNAIETLFPGNTWKGDVSLFFSKLQTKSSGDISLLVPGGGVNVGLPIGNAGVNKSPSDLGISLQGKGNFNALLHDDFNINQSRVFNLGGGDVTIWSSFGNIDAGRGAKSALSAPPPVFTVDENGNQVVTIPPPSSGSGVLTVKKGSAGLYAPNGKVDASEAGIIVAGNITVTGNLVNAQNVQTGGTSSGVPTAPVSLAVGLTGLSNIAANVSQQAQASVDQNSDEKKNKQAGKLGTISVELIGFGA